MGAKYDKLYGVKDIGACNAPNPASDKFRHYVSDIGKVREAIRFGDTVPLTIECKRYDSYDVVGQVTEKYPYHFIVEFRAPSGRMSRRSVMYLDVLHGRVTVPALFKRRIPVKILDAPSELDF